MSYDESTSTRKSESLIKTIKAHIAKGDKAAEKSEQHYIAAGQHLKTLKAQHDDADGTWAEWEALLKDKIGIGRSRASELMQIADGRKTVEQVRAGTAERMRQLRDRSPSRDGEEWCGHAEAHASEDGTEWICDTCERRYPKSCNCKNAKGVAVQVET
jgi:hypothetical protein